MALRRHGDGAWHNDLFLITASNAKCWAVVANHVTRLCQAGGTEIFNAWSRARYMYEPFHGLELSTG